MNVVFFLICDLCIGVGFYIFTTALTEDIKNDFIEFDVWLKSEPDPMLLSKRLSELIQFHSIMKRWVCVRVENWRRHLTFSFFSFRCVCNLADIVQPIFMIVFGANFVTICVAMLSIQIGMVVKSKLIFVEWILQEKIETFFLLKLQSQSNLMLLATLILELLGTFTFLFVPCELAGRISSRFEDINDLITQFDWYLFPQEVKQTLPLIMIISQQEVGFTCLGSFLCNRATFKKVSRT